MGDRIEGKGTITVPGQHGGEAKSYAATLSGTLNELVITVPELMQGGTTITVYIGGFPAQKAAGTFSGTNTVTVGGEWTYTADIDYEITTNENGTININLPEYTLEGTQMGDLTLGAYTISNIPYSEKQQAFYAIYGGSDTIKEHIKAVRNGVTTMDGDYTFSPDSYISIEVTSGGIKVTNSFSFGNMPLNIVTNFEGSIPRGK